MTAEDTESGSPDTTPETVYRRRIEELSQNESDLALSDGRLSNARLVLFLLAIFIGVWAWRSAGVSMWWIAVPIVAFFALVAYHSKIVRRLEDARNAIRFYEHGLARIHDTWAGMGNASTEWHPENHLYAGDLDLFGHGSLFELLDTTRTKFGGSTLASWMCAPAGKETIEERRDAVNELRDRLELREALGLIGARIEAGLHPIRLKRWAEAPPKHIGRGALGFVRVLTVLSLAAFAYMLLGGALVYIPLVPLIIANLLAMRYLNRDMDDRLVSVDRTVQDLRLLAMLAERIEDERFEAPILVTHQARMTSGPQNASKAIRQLERLFVALEQVRNQMFAPITVITNWPIHVLEMIETWREQHGDEIVDWVTTVGELEALCALATYAYEHPDDVQPTLLDSKTAIVIGESLGHPLIPAAQSVRNDVRLDQDGALVVVSGSNMSGKSTYLRAIGINIVLALMGAPVRAASMKLTPCALGASIQVEDSIQEGISHFYAEILRLKAIEELLRGEWPVVFMVDEILHGTNSRDRRIGSEAVVRQLLDHGAVGLITTHDLELTRMEIPRPERLRNVHFEDHMDDGELRFDYTLREGVVAKSNALDLMRSIGLEIRDTPE